MKTTVTLLIAFLQFGILVAQKGGDLDQDFGSSGFSFRDYVPDSTEVLSEVLPLSDGKTLTIGYVYRNGHQDILISRINSNGSPDITFGTNGFVNMDLDNKSSDQASSSIVLFDGKIIIVGSSSNGSTNGFIMRLNADGTLDQSFGKGSKGYTLFNAGSNTSCRPNKVIKIGGSYIVSGKTMSANISPDFSVYKFTSGGILDQSFATSGSKLVSIFGNDNPLSLAVSAEGKIAVSGYVFQNGRVGAILQLKSNGSIDKTFNATGIKIFDFGNKETSITDVEYDDKNRLVAVGYEGSDADINGVVLRLKLNGDMDSTFAQDGVIMSDVGTTTGVFLRNINIMEDASILTSGSLISVTKKQVYALMLTPEGKPHGDFGTGGDVNYELPITSANAGVSSTRIDVNGDIIMGGSRSTLQAGEFNMFLTRLKGVVKSNSVLRPEIGTLNLYPNPAINNFHIDGIRKDLVQLSLSDLNGRVLQVWDNSQEEYEISGEIQNGLYIVRAIYKNLQYSGRLYIRK